MSKFFYSGKIKQENFLSKRDVFLNLIYGKWFNLDIEGCLFIAYAIFTFLYQYYLYEYISIPYLLERSIGAILIIIGTFFFSNALWLQYKENTINKILKFRGSFDVIYGIVLLIFPGAAMNLIYFLSGFFLIALGINYLTRPNNKFTKRLLGLLFLLVGLSNTNIISFFTPYDFRPEIFALFLFFLGIYLIYISINYRKEMKAYEDEKKGFTEYKIE